MDTDLVKPRTNHAPQAAELVCDIKFPGHRTESLGEALETSEDRDKDTLIMPTQW